MLSGLMIKTAVVLGAAALGVEYGRRHPDTPWLDMLRILQRSAGNMRAKAVSWRASKQDVREYAECPETPPPAEPETPPPAAPEPPPPAAPETPATEPAPNDAQQLGQEGSQSYAGQTV